MSAEGRTGVCWNVHYPKVLHYQLDPLPERSLLCPRFFYGFSVLSLLCSFPVTGKGGKSLPLGQNSRHSYSLAAAPLCQQVVLTEGQLYTTKLEGGIDIFKMALGKLKQSQSIHKVNPSIFIIEN